MSNLIGTAPDQVPVNGMLGDLAFQDSDSVKVTDLTVTSQLNLTNASNYNLYASGAGNNYLAGSLGIGSVPSAGQTLFVGKNITGATSTSGVAITTAIQSDVTGQAALFSTYVLTQAATFTLSTIKHYNANQGTFGVGSTVTGQYGFFVDASLTGATNNYGFYGNIASGTGRYNLYMSGTADNYMAGSLGIGATPIVYQTLTVSKNLTGFTSTKGIVSSGQIQSDSTAGSSYFVATSSTQATAFNTAYLELYGATQGTFGVGSTVTNQYGFSAGGSLTGATNNYGFYGNIPAGTGRYNLYMGGTAENYLAGNLTIGSTLSTGVGVSTGAAAFELGGNRTGNGTAYIDIHSATGTDYETRIIRASGANGSLQIIQSGTGDFQLQTSGAAPMTFLTNDTERVRIHESSGNVGIGTSSPNASAILDAQSTTKGVRFPNMTTTQKTAISSPAAGLVVFDTTLAKLCLYTGVAWQTITSV